MLRENFQLTDDIIKCKEEYKVLKFFKTYKAGLKYYLLLFDYGYLIF